TNRPVSQIQANRPFLMKRLDLRRMRVQVLYFAAFRDAAGRDSQTEELGERATVADLWAVLVRKVPFFARFPAMPPTAVNREYVDGDAALRDGDEVAFLPPVAGG